MKSILNIDGFSIKKTINIKGNLIDLSNPIIMGILKQPNEKKLSITIMKGNKE